MSDPMCSMASRCTGRPCRQPERWLEQRTTPDGTIVLAEARVCQVHGRLLDRQGWRFVRELHPVPGFERKA